MTAQEALEWFEKILRPSSMPKAREAQLKAIEALKFYIDNSRN